MMRRDGLESKVRENKDSADATISRLSESLSLGNEGFDLVEHNELVEP